MPETKSAVKNLKEGKFCIMDGEPCRVLDVTISASGKHGAAKARIEVVGMFDNRRRSVVKPADTEIEVPIIDKRNGQVVAIMGENAQVMDLENYETFDAIIPEELRGKISQGGEVQYWIIMGKKMIVSTR